MSQVATFGRKPNQRKALIRGLVYSLVEHGRITTTVAKAKELRRHVERAITLGKRDSLHSKRLLLQRYPLEAAVERIVEKWVPHFKTRPGGYTRIMKIGRRLGDAAEMALIELIDYPSVVVKVSEPTTKARGKKAAGEGKATKAAKSPRKKAAKTA
ncbi:MAG TPA: 50S ribosomal protein L17 [Bdellovibrionales bacterium]|nr:50S ribosomal protein L17 [Bdellovibrionales bacterium]